MQNKCKKMYFYCNKLGNLSNNQYLRVNKI